MARVAWVTGGGRGIGRAIALALARDGHAVAVSSRTREELDEVVREIEATGSEGFAVISDATSFESIRSAADTIATQLGGIDILVNNAGGGVGIPNARELSREARDDALFAVNVELNLHSAYRASQAVLPGMLERHHGRIINIGSGYAKRSGGAIPYTAAKHGLIGLTRAMAAEVAEQGVTINCLCPGWTNTQLINLEGRAQAKGTTVDEERRLIARENLQNRVLEPEELGPMAALLAHDQSAGITGQVISVDGGYKV